MLGRYIELMPHITEDEGATKEGCDDNTYKKHHPIVIAEIDVGKHREDHTDGQNA